MTSCRTPTLARGEEQKTYRLRELKGLTSSLFLALFLAWWITRVMKREASA
jgi:hypothetical protein